MAGAPDNIGSNTASIRLGMTLDLGTAAALLAALVAFGGVVASVAMWIQRVNTDRARFDRFMSTAVRVFEVVLDRLPEGTYEGKSSPIRLNEAGRDASRFLGAKEWARRTAHGTADEIEGMSPYAIQQYCFEYVERKGSLDETMGRKVEDRAYADGTSASAVRRVLALELRDVLISEVLSLETA